MKAYLAGPWFTKSQLRRVEQIKKLLEEVGIEYYSPKDEMLFVPGGPVDPHEVLKTNVDAIDDADFIVCITDGKDTGTIWEAGYAYAKSIAIIYVWLTGHVEQKFNLMLGASGVVVRTPKQLRQALEDTKEHGNVRPVEWSDQEINYE